MVRRWSYYNEIDQNCAFWLRDLIKKGELPDGEVDTRPIQHVRPDDLRGFVDAHFFAGLGGWPYALRLAGYPDDAPPVWTGSCPCQPFSGAGKGLGFADERHLWPDWFHLISIARPPIVFGEQVAGPDGLGWLDLVHADMEGCGYALGVVDFPAAGVGAPNLRQRLWWVADANSDGRGEARGGHAQARDGGPERGGEHGRLADAERGGSPPWPREPRLHDGEEQPQRPGDARGMADASCDRRDHESGDGREQSNEGQRWHQPDDGSQPSGLANAPGRGRQAGPDEPEIGQRRAVVGAPGGRGLGHSPGIGLAGQPRQEAAQRIAMADGQSPARDLGHPERQGLPDAGAQDLPGARRRREGGEPQPSGGPRDPWRELEWIACLDGRRRPVISPFFRMVAGIPDRVVGCASTEKEDVDGTACAGSGDEGVLELPDADAAETDRTDASAGEQTRLPSSPLLRPGMHGGRDDGQDQGDGAAELPSPVRARGGRSLRTVPAREGWDAAVRSSPGSQPAEQRAEQFGNLVRKLPSSLALAKQGFDHRTASALQALLAAIRAASPLRDASATPEALWRSLSDEAKARVLVGFDPRDWKLVTAHPLAHRKPGDVARLRAFGNAINPVVAAEIIRAYLAIRRG